MRSAVAGICRIQLQRRPDVRRIRFAWRKLKTLWHHADDRAFDSVEECLPADDVGVTRKNRLPEAVGYVRDRRRSLHIVGSANQTAFDGIHAERLEQRAAHGRGGHADRLRLAGQVGAALNPRIERGPRMRVPAQVKKFRPGTPEAVQTSVWKRWKLGVDA